MDKVEKVVAYIVRGRQLLVFIHEEDRNPVDESGLQVPAGTCEPDERPEVAILREAHEETGLDNLRIVKYLGDTDYDLRPYADKIQHRHFFQLAVETPVPDQWVHIETSGGKGPGHPFKFYWLPIERGHALAGGQGALLGKVEHSDT